MRRLTRFLTGCFIVSLLLLLLPAAGAAQAPELKQGAPPVEQPLISEGDFALGLAATLGVATTDDAVTAESALGELGIAPRNGWIADYPVTPDIILELKNSVAIAVDTGKLALDKAEALKRVDAVARDFGIIVRPYTAETPYEPSPTSCATYPNPAMIQTSYTDAGTPVVTYYCPPPDYYYMYAWVPCPFWWSDLWFPGFFILRDFHKVVHVHNRVVVIRNHFNDVRSQRAFRVDPVDRFSGKTFSGIGVSRPKDFISTGIPKGEKIIFNAPRPTRAIRGGTVSAPAAIGNQPVVSPVPRSSQPVVTSPAPRESQPVVIPSQRGGERVEPIQRRGDEFSIPRSGGGEMRMGPRPGDGGGYRR